MLILKQMQNSINITNMEHGRNIFLDINEFSRIHNFTLEIQKLTETFLLAYLNYKF